VLLLNLLIFGKWTRCKHPPEAWESFGLERWRCTKCGVEF
jgi:hypothetical protein